MTVSAVVKAWHEWTSERRERLKDDICIVLGKEPTNERKEWRKSHVTAALADQFGWWWPELSSACPIAIRELEQEGRVIREGWKFTLIERTDGPDRRTGADDAPRGGSDGGDPAVSPSAPRARDDPSDAPTPDRSQLLRGGKPVDSGGTDV